MTKKIIFISTFVMTLMVSTGSFAQPAVWPNPSPFQPAQPVHSTERASTTIAAQIQVVVVRMQNNWKSAETIVAEVQRLRNTPRISPQHALQIQAQIADLRSNYRQLYEQYQWLVGQLMSLRQRLAQLIRSGTPSQWATEVVGALKPFASGNPQFESGVQIAESALVLLQSAGVIR